jgi:hypothetical protein
MLAVEVVGATSLYPRGHGPASDNWNGEAYRAWVMKGSQAARVELDKARKLGATSAILIFATGLLLLIEAAA